MSQPREIGNEFPGTRTKWPALGHDYGRGRRGRRPRTARHPEATKKELETVVARGRKTISTEEICRRPRIFFRNLQRADLRGGGRRLCFRPGQPVLVAKSRNDQG